jgi:hypothetical protein
MSAFSGNADPSGKSRDALHLDGPACSRCRVDGVRREADHGIVKGSFVESVLAQTDREFFAIDVVLDGQDRGQRADRQSDSSERDAAEKVRARRGRDRVFVAMCGLSLLSGACDPEGPNGPKSTAVGPTATRPERRSARPTSGAPCHRPTLFLANVEWSGFPRHGSRVLASFSLSVSVSTGAFEGGAFASSAPHGRWGRRREHPAEPLRHFPETQKLRATFERRTRRCST